MATLPRLIKQAIPFEESPEYLSATVDANNQLKAEALHDAGTSLLTSAGIGAGIRGLLGLTQIAGRNMQKRKRQIGSGRVVREISVPNLEDKEARIKKGRFGIGGMYRNVRGPEPTPDSPAYQSWEDWQPESPSFLAGDKADTKMGIPWAIPLTGLAIGGGLYGGYKLTDMLFQKRKEQAEEDELDDAKKKYQNAMLAQYSPDRVEKWSSLDVGTKLSALYKVLTKQAGVNDVMGKLLGSYGLFGGALALGTGVGMYKYIKGRSPSTRIKKVIEQRARERWARTPPEIFAVKNNIPVTQPKYPSNDDDDNDMKEKVAEFVSMLMNK